MNDPLGGQFIAKGVFWVPTATVGEYVAGPRGGVWGPLATYQAGAFGRAVRKGVKLAFGTDAGGFPWTEIPLVREFELYVTWGLTPLQAIRTATTVAAELLGQSGDLGAVAHGHYAGIIAVAGDPLKTSPSCGACGS